MAVYVDKDTIVRYADGEVFHRDHSEEEVLLQPTSKAVAPRLRCSNCGFERQYTFWYRKLHYLERQINYCPGCGLKILGVVANDDD